MFARIALVALTLIAAFSPATQAQNSISCYTTESLPTQNCGDTCLSFRMVEDESHEGGFNVCLRWLTVASLSFVENSAVPDGILVGFDGVGVQLLTCDELIENDTGAPTASANEYARLHAPAIPLFWDGLHFWNGMSFTNFSCCDEDMCNIPIEVVFQFLSASMAFVDAGILVTLSATAMLMILGA
eukprot:gene23256-30483_t